MLLDASIIQPYLAYTMPDYTNPKSPQWFITAFLRQREPLAYHLGTLTSVWSLPLPLLDINVLKKLDRASINTI